MYHKKCMILSVLLIVVRMAQTLPASPRDSSPTTNNHHSQPAYSYEEKLMVQSYFDSNNNFYYSGESGMQHCPDQNCNQYRDGQQFGFLSQFFTSKSDNISTVSDNFDATVTPVVIWHGLGQSCCDPDGVGRVKSIIEKYTKAYVVSIKIGNTVFDDIINSFFMSADKQIEFACKLLANDTRLATGYHAIGFSQGGQFLRAVAQRCPNPPMKNLVTMGSQHQGIYGLPRCPGLSSALCSLLRRFLSQGIYTNVVQTNSVVAQYWHDARRLDDYSNFSKFIADINNEKQKNSTYRENLLKLQKFVMVKNLNDSTVVPMASQHFEFYIPGSDSEILPLRQSKIYLEDWIGLKVLDASGRLVFIEVHGDHIEYETRWFVDNVVKVHLK